MRYRHIINLFFVSTPICVLLRTIQLVFTIDGGTGFIKQQYSTISVLITLIVCATVGAIGMLASSIDGIKQNPHKTQPAVALAGILVGVMFIYQTIANLKGLTIGAWHDMLLAVLCLLSAFVFIAYGLKSIYSYKMPAMILVIPVVYYIVRIINVFVSTSALALITENVFLIFTNSVLLWFMFEFASLENQIGDASKKTKKLFASGIASVMLCTVTAIPKLILIITDSSDVSNGDVASSLLNVAVGIFVFAYIICNFGEQNAANQKKPSKHSA